MKIEDYNKYYIKGSDHYLIPKDEFKELFNEMINWKEESQRQKEVIDKVERIEEFSFNKNNTLIEEDLADMKDKINELVKISNKYARLLEKVDNGE